MAARERLIGVSADVTEGGPGLRFEAPAGPAFAVRYQGRLYAYHNRCAHRSVELDWNEGDFFAPDRAHLVCATHGALYRPDTGRCAGGPCRGGRLEPVAVAERAGAIFVLES